MNLRVLAFVIGRCAGTIPVARQVLAAIAPEDLRDPACIFAPGPHGRNWPEALFCCDAMDVGKWGYFRHRCPSRFVASLGDLAAAF
jgi:hypothetical protein